MPAAMTKAEQKAERAKILAAVKFLRDCLLPRTEHHVNCSLRDGRKPRPFDPDICDCYARTDHLSHAAIDVLEDAAVECTEWRSGERTE